MIVGVCRSEFSGDGTLVQLPTGRARAQTSPDPDDAQASSHAVTLLLLRGECLQIGDDVGPFLRI